MTWIARLIGMVVLPALVLVPTALPVQGQGKKAASSGENEYYKLLTFTPPPGEVLEAGAIEILPDNKVAVGTRRGEVWILENAYDPDPEKVKFKRFAHGMHEILGLAWKDGWLYVTHRPDVTRIKDSDGDGKADVFEVYSEGWDINGDYHEYAFGSRFDKNDNLWFTLCLTGSFDSSSKFRGWAGKITKDRKFVPTTSGVRSPGGIGMNAEDEVFYTDNQGPWNGTCGLKHLTKGGFVGHPDSFKWYKEPEAQYLGKAPAVPKSGSRIMTEAKKIPELTPTVILFPYGKMGQSASGVECDLSGGKFGPFEKQLFVGDQTHSTVMRCFLEKVNGRYQGACFPFRAGFGSGVVPVRQGVDGSLFVGSTNRGWGSRGPKPFAIERVVWTGKVPFEIHEMRAKPDGFELTFTKPIDATTAENLQSYTLKNYTYIYQSGYGSPEVDHGTPTIRKAEVAPDRKSVRLRIDGLQSGHVHELDAKGIRSAEGNGLLHSQAYYTLNYFPAE
ncbi:MAG: hypothetical protein ACKO23_13145 [Gemmataceae bacterium]